MVGCAWNRWVIRQSTLLRASVAIEPVGEVSNATKANACQDENRVKKRNCEERGWSAGDPVALRCSCSRRLALAVEAHSLCACKARHWLAPQRLILRRCPVSPLSLPSLCLKYTVHVGGWCARAGWGIATECLRQGPRRPPPRTPQHRRGMLGMISH